jgi:hypothetical protein
MRQPFPRPLALAVCALALCLASCSSSNKGKIVGKWKTVAMPDTAKQGIPAGATVDMYFEFTADGRFIVTGEVSFAGMKQTKEVATGKYSLGMGSTVTISDITPPLDGKSKSREKIVINGDTMTLDTEKGEKITLTRVTAGAPAGGKEGAGANSPAPK